MVPAALSQLPEQAQSPDPLAVLIWPGSLLCAEQAQSNGGAKTPRAVLS